MSLEKALDTGFFNFVIQTTFMENILVVEDDAVASMLYRGVLEKAGFSVTVADSGKQMMQALNNYIPDLILLDVMLPDANGMELCGLLKKNEQYRSAKVLMVSGIQIRPIQVAKGIDTGADDYLTKPFHQKELLARVRNLVNLRQVEEQLRNKNTQLQKISGYLQNQREEERKTLAEEVHEELGQLASALKMDIDWVSSTADNLHQKEENRLTQASVTADILINTIRKIATTLRPSSLNHFGLNASLEWLGKEFARITHMGFHFTETFDDSILPEKISTELYRICQESLDTIISESESNYLKLFIGEKNGMIHLLITGNGKKFDVQAKKQSLGFIILEERALSLGGEINIIKDEAEGIQINVMVPNPSSKNQQALS